MYTVFRYHPDESTLQRLDYWLAVTLSDLERSVGHTAEIDAEFLEFVGALQKFFGVMQCTLPEVDAFLFGYLQLWNGVDYRDEACPNDLPLCCCAHNLTPGHPCRSWG